MRRAFLAGLLCAAAVLAHAQSPAGKPTRVLFIGNGFTSNGDIPGRVEKLARAMGREASIEALTQADNSLEDHWQEGRAAKAIAKGWDVVVLQQGPSAAPESRAQLIEYGKRFARLARDAGAKPALYMTWPAADRMRDFGPSITSYRAAAAAIDAMVLPVGEAWLRALSADKRLKLHGSSNHAASMGVDLTVLTIYLSLFPAGPQEFDEAFVAKIAKALDIPADRRDLLFDAATRAIDEPLKLQ